jgi:hypothetical protein
LQCQVLNECGAEAQTTQAFEIDIDHGGGNLGSWRAMRAQSHGRARSRASSGWTGMGAAAWRRVSGRNQ